MRPSPGSNRVCGGVAPDQSPDGGDVELPNGYFAQIDHVDPVGGGVSQTAKDQTVDTDNSPRTRRRFAGGAYAKTAADASSLTDIVNSVA